ncbi:hypothetical protein F442_16005 [Phytophthora nicotianae P10297]|uniref:Uncharacterized protein n=3 Tax=Phytophthora nicotianae TaxID=4792 RepID=V9EHK3_PHYNI|nr:hypothetical protein F443_16152 [Phytophthora nicotianae P1569]ETK78222.1 hypothetical protein L915_15701 [Phytophthora nicotianae]ETL31653.1 hypothetical protein L916_15596 [Phytophthora nicotianae]ETM38048.1 hypothetical protein L914_15553 [Phytophthora nicotianae]ETP35935.1 hypothetical protein F442_16005 [Phytophthora nicotianae P10297]
MELVSFAGTNAESRIKRDLDSNRRIDDVSN